MQVCELAVCVRAVLLLSLPPKFTSFRSVEFIRVGLICLSIKEETSTAVMLTCSYIPLAVGKLLPIKDSRAVPVHRNQGLIGGYCCVQSASCVGQLYYQRH